MRPLLALVAISIAGCASAPRSDSVVLNGTLANWAYQTPAGEPMQSAVIELKEPVAVPDLAQPASRVELPLPERYFVSWGQLVGRQVSATCRLYKATLWGYPHASCALSDLQVAP